MSEWIGVLKAYQPYPRGPASVEDVIVANKEVGRDGFLTGGPHSPEEWLEWNDKRAQGWQGRYCEFGDKGTVDWPPPKEGA